MCSCSTSSTVASSGMLTVFEIAPEMNGCTAAHHLDVTHVVDRVVAHRAREHRQVLRVEVGRADDTSCARRCTRRCRRPGRRSNPSLRSARGIVWLTMNIVPPPTSFFAFMRREVGLDAGGVAVHHEADRACRREHAGLRVAHAEEFTELYRLVPCDFCAAPAARADTELFVDLGQLPPGASATRSASARRCGSRRTVPCGWRCWRWWCMPGRS